MNGTTIAARATPDGVGALAILRLSGPQAHDVASAALGGKPLQPRRATFARVRAEDGSVLDEVVATYFAAPASFTGEDVVEISCHGGILVTERVLERLLACGAVPAEPGEFSRRAFENGKLDLTQAEAIMDIIHAGSDLALRAAQHQLQGAIADRVQAALDGLIDVAAHVTAYIDFPEEDIPPATVESLGGQLQAAEEQVSALLATAEGGRLLREGVRTVIVGAPNVGKSSLLNMLLGYDRAIVSDRAGTTRDTIEASLSLGGLCLRLIDTAGLHNSEDSLEQCGMERSRRALAAADLVLEVADVSQPPVPLPSAPSGAHCLLVLNKADLEEHPAWAGKPGIRISCAQSRGRDDLGQAIRSLFLRSLGEADTVAAVNTRHRFALQQAAEALRRARAGLFAGESPDLIDIDLREALDALGSITGRVDTEDILDRVFSTFCLGK